MDWLDRLEPLIELVVHFRARIQRSDTWTQRTRNGLSNGSNKEIGDEVLKGKMGGGQDKPSSQSQPSTHILISEHHLTLYDYIQSVN